MTRYALASGEWLRAVFAAGPGDVWIGGDGGTLLHFDGELFHPVAHPLGANGSIAAAVCGEFGDAQFTSRTSNGELYINPLIAMYWAFEAEGVARRSLYLPLLAKTDNLRQVSEIILSFRAIVRRRPARPIPH